MLPGTAIYLAALRQLSGDRPLYIGMAGGGLAGVIPIVLHGNIPFASVASFARQNGIDDADEFDRLVRLVRAMDDFEIAHLNARANSKS